MRRLVVDVKKKIEWWAVEVLSIKAHTIQKAEQRRYGANAQAWGNALLFGLVGSNVPGFRMVD